MISEQRAIRTPTTIAAVDLGSNSFHMVVARNERGHFKTIDRLREMVRLSAGISRSGILDKEASDRAVACLERFGQRLRDMHADNVRAVGTNALRRAKNPDEFLERAEKALGYPIEIISGIEEARLVYRGATYAVSNPNEKRLVVDIGGGSTELVVGQGMRAMYMESLFMGCVSMSERFFSDGQFSAKTFERAKTAAMLQLAPVAGHFKEVGWSSVLGTSGTIKAICEIIFQQNRSGKEIVLADLAELTKRVIECQHIDKLNLEGLKKERVPVFPGGLVILQAVMESLEVSSLTFSDGGLREGVLYDFLGRLHIENDDVRVATVRSMESRYHVDYEQANRVELLSLLLLKKVRAAWGLQGEEIENYLIWAARLHEIGVDMAHSQYHRHGAYILQHSDMPGFAWNEQRILAAIVACHRRKIRQEYLDDLPKEEQTTVMRLILLLRLAVLMNRERNNREIPLIKLAANPDGLHLSFPNGWLDKRPLTLADLQEEQSYLKGVNITLQFE